MGQDFGARDLGKLFGGQQVAGPSGTSQTRANPINEAIDDSRSREINA
jgi:hypothetical protein